MPTPTLSITNSSEDLWNQAHPISTPLDLDCSQQTKWIPAGWKGLPSHLVSMSMLDSALSPIQEEDEQDSNHVEGMVGGNGKLKTRQGSWNLKTIQKSPSSVTTNSTSQRRPIGIFLLNIPHWVRVPEILSLFTRFGSIINVGLDLDNGFAFVDFENPDSAETAFMEFNGKIFFESKALLQLEYRFDKDALPLSRDVHDSRIPNASPYKGLNRVKSIPDTSHIATNTLRGLKSYKSFSNIQGQNSSLQNNVDLHTLYISNLPSHITKRELENTFRVFGPFKRVHVASKLDRHFGFLTFKSTDSASKALEYCLKSCLYGMKEPLKVDYSRMKSTPSSMELSRSMSVLDLKSRKSREIVIHLNDLQ